jgi:hypothetical protein
MNYLLKVTNTYRVPNETAALALREELDHDTCGELTAFSYTQKQVKAKGEIVDEYLLCKATIEFNKEKDPTVNITAVYEE